MVYGTRWNGVKWVLGPRVADPRRVLDLLLEEYREVNADWRLRDKYVEDKFGQSVFVFALISALLGAAVTAFTHYDDLKPYLPLAFPIGALLFFTLSFFAFVVLISLVKDTYYRDGSGRMSGLLLGVLEEELGCDCVSVLRKEAADPREPDYRVNRGTPFTRKIRAPAARKVKLGVPSCVERLLVRRNTFRWMTAYYLVVTCLCLATSAACLVCWILGVGRC